MRLALELIRNATDLYDREELLQVAARRAAGRGFSGGAEWMATAMSVVRSKAVQAPVRSWERIGAIKYGLASAAALVVLSLALYCETYSLALLAPVAFYLTEAQMVFLFPALIDSVSHPWRRSLALTQTAGGSLQVMVVVIPIAAVMLCGGIFGMGFLRSWSIGCLAIVLWYENVVAPAL